MRVIALLSLIFGFMGLMILDGQPFSHAVMGVILGIAAVGCGFGSARRDYVDSTCRWEGRIMGVLGLILIAVCALQLPSSYRFQTRFNQRSADFRYADDLIWGFHADRDLALKAKVPEAVRYLEKLQFPEGQPSPFSGSPSNYVETERRKVVCQVVAHLRATAENDLGPKPVAWIEKYGDK
jgi:hypothetical protein